MKFLITAEFPAFRAQTNWSTHLHFSDPSADLSVPLASLETVDVWICEGDEVTRELLDRWLGQASHIPKCLVVGKSSSIPQLTDWAGGRLADVVAFPDRTPEAEQEEWEESILRAAERLYARARASQSAMLRSTEGSEASSSSSNTLDREGKKTTVLLVGAGIMNLITAEHLAARGYQVRVVDAGPDPRSCKDWSRLGVTHGGGNARMFTYTEADNYNEKGSKLYANMQSIFRRTVRSGGWSVKPPKEFSAEEMAWVNAFERVPPWMARGFRDDIYQVNNTAGKLWRELIESTPQLFEDVEFRKDILRMYSEPIAVEAAVKLNGELGALLHAPSSEEFLQANPSFRPAAETDHLAGGITVDGFTVNIHPFSAKLIERITSLGGDFQWDCEVKSLQRNVLGEVMAVETQRGQMLEADHYVVSPGVTGNALLEGTASENLLQGVLGVWLQIPNLEPQQRHSIKIHRRAHLVEDINITVSKDVETGEDILMFGGGYGYVGLGRPAADSPELMALFNELEEVARIYFPKGYAAAKQRAGSGSANECMFPRGNRKFCVRPFTPTGLGLFERIPTAGGGNLIITGGNNTGGFAQAPAVACAVLRALTGEHDPIHELFHPDRGKLPSASHEASANGITYKSRFPVLHQQPSWSLSPEGSKPLRVLLLASDGPNHRYLRYRLDQSFPGYRCIVETSEGQVRQLVDKRRLVDAYYMKYHSLRRRLTGHDAQRKAYFNKLVPAGHESPTPDLTVDSVNCRAVWEAVERWQPELTIVSGTKYIGRKLIDRAGLMINLHIGHLPEYKGNHCIFFALYDGAVDKVAATLHQLTPHLDGGSVLDKVVPPILPSDTEETLYARCSHLAIDRVVRHAQDYSKGKRLAFVTQEDTGRTFRHRDRTLGKELWLWWRMAVGGLLSGYRAKPDESDES